MLGAGIDTPDMSNASRRIKKTELEKCQKNGVKNITEVLVGYDGIVFANSAKAPLLTVTRRELFLALAKRSSGKGWQ
ncbi:MAG: substrate-binding domain-containing protein [Enterobacterales bacterium]|nr:substrate-binding domain-containing protein [Enterobacterales bacterium]